MLSSEGGYSGAYKAIRGLFAQRQAHRLALRGEDEAARQRETALPTGRTADGQSGLHGLEVDGLDLTPACRTGRRVTK